MQKITYKHISSTFKKNLGEMSFTLQKSKIIFHNSNGDNTIKIIEKGDRYKYFYRNLKSIYVQNFEEFQKHILDSVDSENVFHHSTWHDLKKYTN